MLLAIIRHHIPFATLISTILTLAGCRFGNQVILAENPTSMSGYYKTEPESMSICADIQGEDWRCASAPTSMIPETIQSVLTNPVYVSANVAKSKAYLIPNTLDTSNYFELSVARNGAMTSKPAVGESKPLWNDESCQTQLQLQKSGQIIPKAEQQEGSFKISGSVEFSLTVITLLSGSCGPTLTDLKACYGNVSACPGSTAAERTEQQQSVQDFFAPYISAGVLTVGEIPLLENLGWEAVYH